MNEIKFRKIFFNIFHATLEIFEKFQIEEAQQYLTPTGQPPEVCQFRVST